MITSNQDALLKIDISDSRIVCLDVSACCRGNIPYFDQLGDILDHPDALEVVMSYLLSCNLTNWRPGKIPTTKMKIETMRDQLPNSIRFIIDHIASWHGNKVDKPSRNVLYQQYCNWCESNGEKPFANNILDKKFPHIGIECKQARTG